MQNMKFVNYLAELKQTAQASKLTPGSGPIIAFFDLDRTLINGYSLTALAWQQISNGDMSFKRFCALSVMFLRYALGRIDYNGMLHATVNDIKGMPENELRMLSQQAYDTYLAKWLYREGIELIRMHQRLGHDVVMVTSATSYQAEPIATALNIEHVCSTALEIVDGKVAGGVEPCFGQGKVVAAMRYAQHVGTNLSAAYFYSDSKDDLPLLEQVGTPVVVNGKPKLAKLVARRGWPSIEFNLTVEDAQKQKKQKPQKAA